MVVGRGMIASRFKDFDQDDNIVIFASGVSNSKETDLKAFQRERDLVEATLQKTQEILFIYFSTCSIEDPSQKESLYVKHKLDLEEYIKNHSEKYLILRTSNVVGGNTNPHTVLNFFYNKVKSCEYFEVWNQASRNLIDIDDVFRIARYFIEGNEPINKVVNVANPASISAVSLVKTLESFLGKKGNYKILDKGIPFEIDIAEIATLFPPMAANFYQEGYLLELLKKYYQSGL